MVDAQARGRIVVESIYDDWLYLANYPPLAPRFWHEIADPTHEENNRYPSYDSAVDRADGVALLGGEETLPVGFVRRSGGVRLARFLGFEQLERSGLLP